jgi:hypothetical protein
MLKTTTTRTVKPSSTHLPPKSRNPNALAPTLPTRPTRRREIDSNVNVSTLNDSSSREYYPKTAKAKSSRGSRGVGATLLA